MVPCSNSAGGEFGGRRRVDFETSGGAIIGYKLVQTRVKGVRVQG